MIWNLAIRGVDFYHLVNWFFIYSFFGWLWETCFVSIKQGKYVNRGFINGPFCTIYGFGAISVYLILLPFQNSLLLLFTGGVVVATCLEYMTAVLMESIFHTSWWDYSDKKFNFQGRICLGASLGWGFFTLLLFRLLHPVVTEIVSLYSVTAGEIIIISLVVFYSADFGISAITAFRLHERIPAWEQSMEQMRGELLLKMQDKMGSVERLKNISIDNVKERLYDVEVLKELEARRASLMADLTAELQKRKESMAAKIGFTARRYMRAYPNLNRGYKLHKQKREEKKRSH